MGSQTYFFQIGFNKCATTSLSKLFQNSGYRSVHGNARRTWRRPAPGHPVVSPQINIENNIRSGRPALERYEGFVGFFDMCLLDPNRFIENFKRFYIFARDYPDAKFILNVRDKSDWLRSRLRHKDGRYLKSERRMRGMKRQEVLRYWSDDFDRHTEAVQTFFAAEQDRLLVFDVDKSPVEDLISFCEPEIKLDRSAWTHYRVTDQVVRDLGWKDRNAEVQEELRQTLAA